MFVFFLLFDLWINKEFYDVEGMFFFYDKIFVLFKF